MAERPPLPIPSLIIGLGGTGAVTVMHIKQQLLNMHHNELPKTVGLAVFDTSKDPLAQFPDIGIEREQGSGVGAITFAPNEYGHVGGDAQDIMKKSKNKRDQSYGHISSWLQSDWYLENLGDALINIENGAGMYRQLGRLGLFMDMAAANFSNVYKLLREKINSLRANIVSQEMLKVFIVGSFAGGTGAGTFIDTAHIIRQLAKEAGINIHVRGIFFLPETFSSVLGHADITKARARTFAALRELSRFTLNEDNDLGYPMHYHAPKRGGGGDGIWHGSLTTKLYDLVYLIDGYRAHDPMNNYPLYKGVAPSVADTIMAFIDNAAGNYQTNYTANLNSVITDAYSEYGKELFVGSIGSYTIVLPIQQIIEGWAFQLAMNALETVLKPSRFDETTNLPSVLATNENPERSGLSPEDEVEKLLKSREAIADRRNPGQRKNPTALWPKLHEWAENYHSDDEKYIVYMVKQRIDYWLAALRPKLADNADQESKRASRRIENILGIGVINQVKLSQEDDNDYEPARDHVRIRREVEGFYNKMLGAPKNAGERIGGTFRDTLNEFVKFQADRFYETLEAYVLLQMNGQDDTMPLVARQGKLGWTLAVCESLQAILQLCEELIDRIRTHDLAARERTSKLGRLENAERFMLEQSTEKKPFFGSWKALDAQEDYRLAAQDVYDMHRTEIARDVCGEIVRKMRGYVQSVIEQLKGWRTTLATDHEGLYARAYFGKQRVIADRNNAEAFPSREVINDPEWENQLFTSYVERANAMEEAVRGFEWVTTHGQDNKGDPQLRVQLVLKGTTLRDDMGGKWSDNNLNALIGYCRDIFKEARSRESVLHYLAGAKESDYMDQPEKLASYLHRNSEAMIEFHPTTNAASKPSVYLLAHQDPNYPKDIEYINKVMAYFRRENKVSQEDETFARLQEGDDRFRMTLVSAVEVLRLSQIGAYDTARQAYLNSNPDTRALLHIFPAEINTVTYENRLPQELNESPRIFTDRVTILLEREGRLREFLSLLAHKVIAQADDWLDTTGEGRSVWYLTTAPKNPDEKDMEEWWLSESDDEPSLLEAITTYVYREKDYGLEASGHKQGIHFPIDYPWVKKYLNRVRDEDTSIRMNEDNWGRYDTELKGWVEKAKASLEDEDLFNFARIVVEHDVLYEYREKMLQDLGEMVRKASRDSSASMKQQRKQQDLIDLYTVFVLMLRRMMTNHKRSAIRAIDQ